MSVTTDGEQVVPYLSDPAEVASESAQQSTPHELQTTITTITPVCDSDEPLAVNGDSDTGIRASGSSASSTSQPTMITCVNNPDLFCYVCGFPCFITKRKSIRKSEIAQQAYQSYYGRIITDLDEIWTPNFFCTSCYNKLYIWYRDLPTGQNGMDFCEPMIWGKPNEDHSDCYFCAVPKKYISNGPKNRKDLVMPIMKLCVLLPRRTPDNFDIPEPPKNCGIFISINANQRDVDIDHDYAEDPSNEILIPGEPEMVPVPETPKPEAYTNVELQQLLADLQPLSTEQQEVLVASLVKHNLVIREVRETRSRIAGKRISYKFAMDSPKRTRLSVKSKVKVEIERRPDDLEAGTDVGFDMPPPRKIFRKYTEYGYSSDEEGQDDDKDQDYMPNEYEDKDLNREEGYKTNVINLSCTVEGCQAVLIDKSELLAHLLAEHGIQRHTCLFSGCFRNFKVKSRFRTNISKDHALRGRNKEDVLKCGQCETAKSFRSYDGLKRHHAEHHAKGSYGCGYPECRFILPNGSTMAQMTAHIRAEHKKKLYSCNWPRCTSKGFTCQSALDKHFLAHKGVLPFPCEQKNCDKRFASLHSMKSHVVRDHTGVMPYACETCGKELSTKEAMKKHVLKHGEPQYTCSVCGKQYIWASSYRKHMAVHRGERSHRCPSCNKGFFWPANLRKHIKNGVCTTEKGRRRSYKRGDLPFSSNLHIDSQPPAADAAATVASNKAPRRRQKKAQQSQQTVEQPPPQIHHHPQQQQQHQLPQTQPNHLQHHHNHQTPQQQLIYIQPHHQQQQQRPHQMTNMLGTQPGLYGANQLQASPMYQMNAQFEQQHLQQLQQLQMQQQNETAQSIEMLFGSDWNLN